MNLVAADGDVWRKHRRIMGPAFNNKLCVNRSLFGPTLSFSDAAPWKRYDAVWEETLKTYHEMVAEEGWTNKDQISVTAVQNLTFKASRRVCRSRFILVKLNATVYPVGPSDHRKVWVWVLFYLVRPGAHLGRPHVRAGSTAHRRRHVHDLYICPRMDPEAPCSEVHLTSHLSRQR